MSAEFYKELTLQAETTGHFWVCRCCKSSSIVFKKQLAHIEKRIEKVEVIANKNEGNITDLTGNVETMKRKLDRMEQTVQESQGKAAESAEEAVFAEFSARENKKNNLVFHNMKEPSLDLDAEGRKAADLKALKVILDFIGQRYNQETDIKLCRRIGRRSEDENARSRPMLVGLDKPYLKQGILSNARKLKDSVHSGISIVPDLTQRKDEAALREEADKKNAEMTPEDCLNWVWKVVGPRGQRRLARVPVQEGRDRSNRPHHSETGTGPSNKKRRLQEAAEQEGEEEEDQMDHL